MLPIYSATSPTTQPHEIFQIATRIHHDRSDTNQRKADKQTDTTRQTKIQTREKTNRQTNRQTHDKTEKSD